MRHQLEGLTHGAQPAQHPPVDFLGEALGLPGGRLARVQIHHWPWPLQDALGKVDATGLLAAHNLPVTGPPPVRFS